MSVCPCSMSLWMFGEYLFAFLLSMFFNRFYSRLLWVPVCSFVARLLLSLFFFLCSEIGHAMAVGTIHSLHFFAFVVVVRLLVAAYTALCVQFMYEIHFNLIYSKSPTTDDSRQYYIKLLLRFCAPSPYAAISIPFHSKRTLYAVVLLFQQNEDKVKRAIG